MPHVIVKMWPGRSEAQKEQLAAQIAKDMMEIIQCPEDSISIAVEEIAEEEWKEKVHPEIFGKDTHLYKKPGYSE